MSFKLHKHLRESLSKIRKPNYTSAHIAVLECLAYRIDDTKKYCFPSVNTIGNESYMSERNARKILSELEQDGIVEVVRFSRKSNQYRLSIWPQKNIDYSGNSVDIGAAISATEQAVNSQGNVSDSRLTYNSNQSFNPVRDVDSYLFLTNAPSEPSLLSETGCETGFPVSGVTGESAANSEIMNLHSLLMKKIGSKCPKPSARDIKLLTEAVGKFGSGEIYQVVEAIFKQTRQEKENKRSAYWLNRVKQANYPCSMFCSSLTSMKKQLDKAEEDRLLWSRQDSQE